MAPTMRLWASSTTDRRCGWAVSRSSWSISAPRVDMLRKMVSLTSSVTPRSASPRSFWSTSRSSSWMSRSVRTTMSSKVKSFWRISSASSPSVSAIASSTVRSVERPARLSSSASESTPPACGELLGQDVGELEPQPALDVLDDARVGVLHRRDAHRDVGLHLGRQRAEHAWRPASCAARRRRARSSAAPRRPGRSRSAPAGCGAGSRTGAARRSR